ncbi:MAG: cobalamin-dependent protein [Candidatus Bathyarchaeota archaeon]|nr:cobalamin-dependent protein [Candidatus Termiticorpusculum sp.]MCL1971257.1 cobalamin-dependent protein [Candidatus Termiticorpusculum sp.]
MGLHVTLVNPPYRTRPHQHPPFPPLGIGYLAAVLEKNDFSVEVIDCQASRYTYDDYKREIAKREIDVIGVTAPTRLYNSAKEILKISKKVHPNAVTMLGGAHVTFWNEKALQECPQLDVVVRKEGEYTLLELAERLEANKDISDVAGTTQRKDDGFIFNVDRPYIENLDELPFPARHLWDLDAIRQQEDMFYLITTRGCTAWCNFCAAVRMFGQRYRVRSIQNVVDELEFLNKTYTAENFTFCDDAFTVDMKRTEALCEEILRRNLKIKWNMGTRVDRVSKGLLQKMKNAGCVSMWCGLESGTQEVLNGMHKGISTDQTRKALSWVRELGLKPTPNVLLGYPGETMESALKSIKFAEEVSPDEIAYYNIATPYPGTPMYDEVMKNGWIRNTNFDDYDATQPIFETPQLSLHDLQELYDYAFKSFYTRPGYVLRMWRKGFSSGYAATKRYICFKRKKTSIKTK